MGQVGLAMELFRGVFWCSRRIFSIINFLHVDEYTSIWARALYNGLNVFIWGHLYIYASVCFIHGHTSKW